jgi:AcrR family transcriptional regulator
MRARADGVEATRRRILTQARDRFVELPYDEVTLAEIAGAAGVTQQTLLNHFASKEGLLLAVVELLRPEIEALRGTAPPGDVAAFVCGLLRQYESLGDANIRLAAVAERIPELAAGLELARRTHSASLEAAFGDSLPRAPRERRRGLAALYAVTDVGTWKLLRRDLGLSRVEVGTVLRSLLAGALASLAEV